MIPLALPCIRGEVGSWIYYITVLSAEQIRARVKKSHVYREASSLEDYLQRGLHDRYKKITQYILTDDNRFFNSIVVGVYDGLPDWYPFDLNQSTHKNLIDHANFPLNDSLGILLLTGHEQLFAIDGLHRVHAIQTAHHDSPLTIQADQYPVVLVAHQDTKDGKRRTRRLFGDINKKAVRVAAGDLAIIDEEDPCPIVARRLYASYPRFFEGGAIRLTPSLNMPPGDMENFTNLLTLVQWVKSLKRLCLKKRGESLNGEEYIQRLHTVCETFLDDIVKDVPVIAEMLSTDLAVAKKAVSHYRSSKHHSLLSRPLGQQVLAEIYVACAKAGQMSRFHELARHIDFRVPGGHFDKILWRKGKIQNKGKMVAVLLGRYLLGILPESELAELKKRHIEAADTDLPTPLWNESSQVAPVA